MSGSLHDVKNEIWMKTVVISIGILVVGVIAYGVLAMGIGSMKHHEWEEAHDELENAESSWNTANETGTFFEFDVNGKLKVNINIKKIFLIVFILIFCIINNNKTHYCKN